MKHLLASLVLVSAFFACKNGSKAKERDEAPAENKAADGAQTPSGPDQNQNSGQTPSTSSSSGTFVADHGLLRAVKGKLVDKNDQPIQLRGMSLFWSQYAAAFWNKDAVAAMKKEWKSTLIRAAMGVEQGGYLTNPTAEKQRVTTVVDAAVAQDLYVIIDWHDHNAEKHPEKAVEFFTEMAKTYANVPNVMFEIYNEPLNTVSWTDVKAYAETVIKAIRSQGARNLIIVGSPTWSQDVDVAANNPITSDDNIAYTLHFYAATHRQGLRDRAKTAINKGLTLFVTEFGLCEATGDGVLDKAETDLWMKFMDDNKISWANWSLFDKPEAASALKEGAAKGGAWTAGDLTESGAYVKEKIMANAP